MRQLLIIFSITFGLLILFTPVAFAQSRDQGSQIAQIKQSILTIQELERQNLLTPAEADKSIAYYVAQAEKDTGRPLTLRQILATPDPSPLTLTPLQEFAGAIDFLNVMMGLAVVALGGALIYLFRYFVQKLFRLLTRVPIVVYEMAFYLLSLACGLVGWLLPPPMHQYLAFLACLLIAGALGMSASSHRRLAHVFPLSLLLFLVWAPTAFFFDSALIGFLASGALLTALGFNLLVIELFGVLHAPAPDGRTLIERATLGAFLMLFLFWAIHLLDVFVPALAAFEFGTLFLGGVVGYGGLLVLSCRWYEDLLDARHRRRNYWGFQIIATVAGLGALFFGSLLQISELQKIGGTFFVLYCIMKLAEIPTGSRPAFALLVAIIGILIIGFCWFSLAHPELFRQWLFLPG